MEITKQKLFGLKIPYESLVDSLGLPEGYSITEVINGSKEKDCRVFKVHVEGPGGFRVRPGEPIPYVRIEDIVPLIKDNTSE